MDEHMSHGPIKSPYGNARLATLSTSDGASKRDLQPRLCQQPSGGLHPRSLAAKPLPVDRRELPDDRVHVGGRDVHGSRRAIAACYPTRMATTFASALISGDLRAVRTWPKSDLRQCPDIRSAWRNARAGPAVSCARNSSASRGGRNTTRGGVSRQSPHPLRGAFGPSRGSAGDRYLRA